MNRIINKIFGNIPQKKTVKIFYYGSIAIWFTSLIISIVRLYRNLVGNRTNVILEIFIICIGAVLYAMLIKLASKHFDNV